MKRHPNFLLTTLLSCITLCLGLLHSWSGRDSMNPDGMSYLDVGDSFFRHDWANALNAWWSPLYPWTIGVVLGAVKPSLRWEFPLVHAVNFGIFAIAMLAFTAFLRALLDLGRDSSQSDLGQADRVPDWPLILCAYGLFWWVALEIETLYDVAPDLTVTACFFAAAAMLIRLKAGDKLWRYALFGLILSIGYWTKAVLFPLGIVILVVAYWWKRSDPGWRKGIIVAAIVFAFASAPLIILLSKQKKRATFGDSGRLNYVWSLSPNIPRENWQGREPGSGTPLHPTRQLMEDPSVYEFDGPVGGTYPPRTDPSYWNDGVQGHFRLKSEVEILFVNTASEIRLLTRDQSGVVVGILALALLGGYSWWSNLRRVWPLIAISLLGMAAYLPLVENDRYLGGFVLGFFLLLLWAGQSSSWARKSVISISFAVFVSLALGTADYTLRILTKHYAIPGVEPNPTRQDVVAAEELRGMGLHSGEKIAIIGKGTRAYWARLAKLRIVAEVRDAKEGAKEFWSSPPEAQDEVFRALGQAHALRAIATCSSGCPAEMPDGWQPITGTPYWIHSLP